MDPDEDEKPKCLKPTILPEIVNEAKARAKNVLANQSKGKNRGLLILIIKFLYDYICMASKRAKIHF